MKWKSRFRIWSRLFRIYRKEGLSRFAMINVSIMSMGYMLANGALTNFVAEKSDYPIIFLSALLLFGIHPFYTKNVVLAKGWGIILVIFFSALGYTIGTQIF